MGRTPSWLDDPDEGLAPLKDPFAPTGEADTAAAWILPPLATGDDGRDGPEADGTQANETPEETPAGTCVAPAPPAGPDEVFILPASTATATTWDRWFDGTTPTGAWRLASLSPPADAGSAPLRFSLAADTGDGDRFRLLPDGARTTRRIVEADFWSRPMPMRPPPQRHPAAGTWQGIEPTRRISRGGDATGDTGHPAGWDGTEQTQVTPAAPQWDGTEQTRITPTPAPDWDGTEQTRITPPTGSWGQGVEAPDDDWTGVEDTLVGLQPGEEADPGSPATTDGAAPDTPQTTRTGTRAYRADDARWASAARRSLPGIPAEATEVRTARQTRDPAGSTPTPATLLTGTAGRRTSSGDRQEVGGDGWHMQGRRGAATGQVWGDYELGGIIGEGGMGTVYRAVQGSLGRHCAVKVLAPHLAENPQLRERFELESRAAGLMRSANIVAVYAAGNINGQPYYVMEYVEGTDLDKIIRQRRKDQQPFSTDEAIGFVLGAARGLVEADTRGIVHRDIKPPNLMITKDGTVKITDFGIVKVKGESNLTLTGQAMGTPAYISPEQGRGEAVDVRSDLYSLGVVFYELLTMERPFKGATADALIYQHSFEEPKLPCEIDPEIPPDVQAISIRLLAKKPDNRYQSADELARDLADILEGKKLEKLLQLKLSTGGAEALRAQQSWFQRRVLPLTITVAAAAVLMIAGLVWWDRAGQASLDEREYLDGLYAGLERDIGGQHDLTAEIVANLRDFDRKRSGFTHYTTPIYDRQVADWWQEVETVAGLRGELAAVRDEIASGGWRHEHFATLRSLGERLTPLIGGEAPDLQQIVTDLGEQQERIATLRSRIETVLGLAAPGADERDPRQDSLARRRAVYESSLAEVAPLLRVDDPLHERWQERMAALAADAQLLGERLDEAVAQVEHLDAAQLDAARRDLERAGPLFALTEEGIDHPPWHDRLDGPIAALDRDRAAAHAHFVTGRTLSDLGDAEAQQLRGALQRLIDLRDGSAPRRHLAALGHALGLRESFAAGVDEWPIPDAIHAEHRGLRASLPPEHPERLRWQAHFDRLAELDASLAGTRHLSLPQHLNQALPLALAELRELGGLLGSTANAGLLDHAARLEALYGPIAGSGRVAWASRVGRDDFGSYAVLVVDAARQIQVRFRYVPPGPIRLGTDRDQDPRDPQLPHILDGLDLEDETPVDWTVQQGFWLAEAECTQKLWRHIMGTDPSRRTSHGREDQRPVNNVDLADITDRFIPQLLATCGRDRRDLDLRLPAEDEWELACRSGTRTPWNLLTITTEEMRSSAAGGPTADGGTGHPLLHFAWYAANATGHARPVLGGMPNAFGLYNMHGNVWEWCANRYEKSLRQLANLSFPTGRSGLHVIRGGSWGDHPASLRSANRCAVPPSQTSGYLGFRLCITAWPDEPDGAAFLADRPVPAARFDRIITHPD